MIDTVVYDAWGHVVRTGRAKLSIDTTSYIWTDYKYDLMHRLYKTTFPGSQLTDSVRYIDFYTTERRSPSGQKTRVKTDFFGNETFNYLFESDTSSVPSYKDSAVYGPLRNPLQTTDFKGLIRTYRYDKWGQQIEVTDPDVGTKRTWYDRGGRARYVRYNTDSVFSYFKYDADKRLVEEGTVNSPDTTKVDILNYPDTSVTSRVICATYKYDSYSRSEIAVDTGTELKYSRGRVTEVVDRAGPDTTGYTYYYYDKRGRVGLKTTWISGLSSAKKLRFEYYANDALKRITYPDTTKHTDYSYLQTGQLRGISDIIGQDSIDYEGWGAVNEIKFKNGLKSKYGYDNLGRVTQTINHRGTNKYFSRAYTYDAAKGFLIREQDSDTSGTAGDSTRSYTFDYLGRLTKAWLKPPGYYGVPARTANYTYDMNNNIVSRNLDQDTVPDVLQYTSGTNFNNLMRFDDDSTWYFTKDSRGRTTSIFKFNVPVLDVQPEDTIEFYSGHTTRFQYDHRNLLKRVIFEIPSYGTGDYPDTVSNLYDASGHKVRQIYTYHVYVSGGGGGGGGEEGFMSSGDEDVLSMSELIDSIGTDGTTPTEPHWERRIKERYYIWSGNQVILELDNPNTITEINIYGLGKQLARRFPTKSDSLHVMVTDYHGSLRSDVPFGTGYNTDLIEYYPYGELLMQSGTNLTNREFVGKERDYTRELDFGPRYYNGTVGHFLSPDPILATPSAYAYTNGNPIMQSDPSGLLPEWGGTWLDLMEEEEKARSFRDRCTANAMRELEELQQYETLRGDICAVMDGNGRWTGDILNRDPSVKYLDYNLPGVNTSNANAINHAYEKARQLKASVKVVTPKWKVVVHIYTSGSLDIMGHAAIEILNTETGESVYVSAYPHTPLSDWTSEDLLEMVFESMEVDFKYAESGPRAEDQDITELGGGHKVYEVTPDVSDPQASFDYAQTLLTTQCSQSFGFSHHCAEYVDDVLAAGGYNDLFDYKKFPVDRNY